MFLELCRLTPESAQPRHLFARSLLTEDVLRNISSRGFEIIDTSEVKYLPGPITKLPSRRERICGKPQIPSIILASQNLIYSPAPSCFLVLSSHLVVALPAACSLQVRGERTVGWHRRPSRRLTRGPWSMRCASCMSNFKAVPYAIG